MAEAAAAIADAKLEDTKVRPPRRTLRLALILGLPLLLLGGAGTAVMVLKPDLLASVTGLLPGKAAAPTEGAKPIFVELPEMTVTLPNAGRTRQLRVRLTLELAKTEPNQNPADVVGPRVYDSLIIYMRTLRDTELDGAIAVDRLRGDLFRRIDLLLGHGVLRDVLITGLVIA